jgi:hypothetical protein
MTGTIVGHFSNSDDAQVAIGELERAGFTADDVSYVATDTSGRLAQRLQGGSEAGSAISKGVAAGGVSGLLLSVAALAVPGIGPIVAAGPIAATLTAAGVGAAAGGFLGALADMGVPEGQARRWADAVSKGGALVIVRVNDDNRFRARAVLESQTVIDVSEHDAAVRESGVYDPANPHTEPANYGDEGGSSQWGQTVLRVDENGETKVVDRTTSRDK